MNLTLIDWRPEGLNSFVAVPIEGFLCYVKKKYRGKWEVKVVAPNGEEKIDKQDSPDKAKNMAVRWAEAHRSLKEFPDKIR